MRHIATSLAVLAVWAVFPAAAQAIPGIDVECNGSSTCEGVWFTSPVVVDWSVSAATETQGCTDITIRDDTTGSLQGCIAKGSGTASATVNIQLDQTPPEVTGILPARPPDHDGWYTHPITFASQGSDATSGLESCNSASYGGPDTANAAITVTCRDRAGLSASRAFPLSYDATPPDVSTAVATTGDRVVRLRWPAGSTASVVRTPGLGGAVSSVVHEGSGAGLTDRDVRNGRRYRYVLTLSDEAGNSASRELSAVPDQRLLAPARSATLVGPPLLTWTPVRNARYYNVQVFRKGRKILSAWPRRAALQLKSKWRFRGKRRRLHPGVYRWYVWPGKGRREARRYGKRIGKRSFTVARRQ